MKHAALLAVPLFLSACALLSACAGFDPASLQQNDQGRLQPQTVRGPCTVKKFFLLSHTAVHTEMEVRPGADACVFTVLNPDIQAFPSAVLVSSRPSHGTATAGLVNGGRSPLVSYTPQPGFRGTDSFTVTIEPDDHAVAVHVTVGAP